MGTAKMWEDALGKISPESVWSAAVNGRENRRHALSGDRKTEVLIVGAGLAGLLTAWRLKQAGVPCLVVEARTVGSGVSKNTTAKMTAQHGLIYADLIQRFGVEKTRLYYTANIQAIEAYRTLAGQFPCDLEERTAYVYTMNDRAKLEREADAYRKLGIGACMEESPQLPFKTMGAIGMEKQAQFHPMKLLTALSDCLEILENTFVRRIDGSHAITDKGCIHANHIVLATHFPLVNIPGLYFLKLYQHRSYVVALEGVPLPGGMYVDERQEGHSFRSYGDLLLIGGGDHKTGKRGGGYTELAGLAVKAYPGAKMKYRWAAQDCMTLDGIPYIGRHRLGKERLYVATGFNKWGMTGSMVASGLLCDLITKGKSELEELYSPRRSIWTKQLAVNIGSAAAGLFAPDGPRCTHMGCKLHKNHAEGTWDCSCHGSRFDDGGHVVDNPAKRRLRL